MDVRELGRFLHIIVSVIYKTAISRLRASQLAIAAVIPAMVWMTYWPLRLAWADRLSRSSDAATVARAVRMSPGDADLRLRLADAQQAAGIDPTSALEAAAKLDPASADTWIRLGLAAEMRGDLRAAETRLLEASRVSQQFAPRWALAKDMPAADIFIIDAGRKMISLKFAFQRNVIFIFHVQGHGFQGNVALKFLVRPLDKKALGFNTSDRLNAVFIFSYLNIVQGHPIDLHLTVF